MSRPDALLLYVLLIVTIFVVALAQDCAYTIKIQTGTRDSSGTDSVIRVIIADKSGQYIEIKDLETWGGKMPPGHDYFENGNLDIFSGKERCLPSPICFLTLNSNGSGNKPGWYVEYVNVTTDKKGSPIKRQHFGVQQWLALDEPPYELSTERNNCQKDRKGMIIGISVSGFVLLTFFIASLMVFLKRKKKAEETANLITSINEDLERGAGPRKFTYNDLAAAANNFSDDRKLGKGGFGAVYRGYLNSLDMMVAIKKFGGGSNQGRREFITEVKIISSLRHRNLVQLIGWCHEKDEFLMIYELMPNGSLDTHLFGKKPHLAWPVRCKITLGLASALLYLHEEWEQCVVHRDIKASNVLLDSNFNAKLGDFGLARLMDHELGPQTTGLAGTFGYMSPEYISTGRASKESDVYSFGVVTLEIVTGRKSVDPRQGRVEPETSLVEKVWDLYGKGEVVTAIDEKLRVDGFDEKQAECLMVIGLWCAHPDRNSRPSIKQAIQVLNLEAPLPRLPTEMPVATYQVSSSTTTSVSSGGATATFSSVQLGR